MALDPSVILQAGKGVTPLLSSDEILSQKMERELEGMRLSTARQNIQDSTDQRRIAQTTPANGLADAYWKGGYIKPAMEVQKFQTEQQKTQRDTEKAKIEAAQKHFEFVGQLMGGVRDQASLDNARQQAAEALGAEAASKIPAMYDPAVIENNQRQAMSVKERLDLRLREITSGETQRHNQATEQNSLGSLDVARGNLAVNQQRLAVDQSSPKGQVVQTAEGPVIVDPRTGTSRPVTDLSGNAARRPGKDIPPNVNKSIIENQQSISKIDKAIAAITAKPSSLGLQYAIPGAETLGQYVDPEGVEARAGVADIGSLILHDRSGAAVTASETPRLRPFIPTASDSPEVAKKKLARFKAIYEEEAGLLAQTYSADQGYKESPALKPRSTASSTPSATPAGKAIKRRGSLGGRKVVEYTDGSVEYAD